MTASSIKVNAFGKVILFPAGTSADEIESTLNAQEHLLNPDYNKPSQNSIVESAKGVAKDLLGIDVDGIYQDFKNSGKSIADLAEESSLKGENTAATQIVGAPVRQSAYNQALQDPTFGIKPNDSLIPRKPDRFGILSRIRDAANKDGSGQEFQSNLSNAITDAAPDPEGGFIPSAISTAGQTIKGVGRIGSDYLGYDKNNPIAAYGQKLIDENPVAVRGLEDIQDKPFIAVKEALGSSAPSMAGMVGAKALGVGITSLAPLTGPAAPIIAAVGIAVQWLGPAAVASLPSYSSIRDKQILNDPENESDGKSKAIAALGAGAVGVIEQAFGPQQWALSMMTKEGRSALARKFAATTTIGAITKGAVKGGVIEASEELAQNPIEQLASFDDPTTDESIKETLFSGAMGALGGGVMGGTIAGASNISNGGSSGILKEKERLAKMKADAENERNLKSGLDNINSAQNVDEAIQAAVETVSTKPVTANDVLKTVDPTLLDVERLTGLKPSEVINDLNIQGEQDVQSETSQKAKQKAGQKPVLLGNDTEIVLPDGQSIPAKWAVVDADQVSASIKEGINQPRDRTRAASDIQIKSIANNPDYRRLSDSPIMDVGAPVLSHDGLIVGGNGRFEGISQAHSQGTGKEYLRTLKEDAINKGIDPALIDGMKSPVLVRRITQPFDTRKLAIASNSGLTLEMSPLEKAHVDAERMVGVEDLDITDNGDIALTEKNYVKLKDVLSDYNVSELGSLADKNLRLSPEGVKRIKNALLSKAFGNSEILSRIIDSTSDDMRNVHGALIKSAGVVAKTKAEILSGKVPDALDITENLLGAVETFAQIRAKGQPLDNYLAQDDLASERIDADTQEILKFLHDNIRSQKKLTEFIKHAYSQISNIDQSTEDIFGDNIVPSKKEIIQDAKQNTTDRPEATQQGFFDKSSEKSGQADGQEYKTEEGNVGSGKESGKESGLRKGKVGEKLVAGDIVLTASGRETTPFPKIDLDSKGKATNTLKRVDAWLIDNAIKEAESRGDEFNLLQFRNVSLKNLSQADKDSAELYLFEKQPDVVKSIFKDKFKNKDDAKFSRTPDERLKDRERAKQLERKLREQGFDFTVTAKDVRDFTSGDRGKENEADAAEKIAKIFGRRIVWIEARGDHAINGVVIPSIKDTIFIDVNTDKAANAVMGHELSHHLEHDKPEVYKELTRSLMTVIRDHPGYAKKYGIEGARQSDITKEIVGDIMGDNFTKPEFWSRVAEANPSVFKNIADTIISWLRRLIINAKARSLGSEQWVTDAQKAQDIVAQAVAQYTESEATSATKDGGVKFNTAVKTVILDGVERPIENSEGKPINNPVNFWRWFGDDANVDDQGRPRVLYHSTLADVTEFNPVGKFMGYSGTSGISLTDNKEIASRYLDRYAEYGFVDGVANQPFSKNVMPVYVKIGKFIERNEPFRSDVSFGAPLPKDYIPAHVKLGYDTVIRDDSISRKGATVKHSEAKNALRGKEYIVSNPNQIKSAIGNNGEYSSTNNGIQFSRAFHGSPYNHDKFDSSKIGTGEGAQAYGHGLYFAESKDVAEYYKKVLTDGKMAINGIPFEPKNYTITEMVANHKGSDDSLISRLETYIKWNSSNPYAMTEDAQIVIDALKDGTLTKKVGGKLYQVELAPKQDEYLLWDKQLSEQSEKVKSALDDYVALNPKVDIPNTATGRDIYNILVKRNVKRESAGGVTTLDYDSAQKPASDMLRFIGIRGIKYLDGSSRGKGEGNYNYVIFDDNDIKIEAKFSKVAAENTLIAQHNLSVKNLLHADRMGGLAAPSIAVTDKAHPLKGFGEITLLSDKDLVDPKQGAKTYGSDIYSPRYPQLSYDFSGKAIKKLNEILSDGIEKTGDREFYNDSLENDPFRELTHSSAAMYQFLKEQGADPKLAFTKPKELPNESFRSFADSNMDSFDLSKDEKFKEAVKEHFAQISDREKIDDDAVSNLVRAYAHDVISYRDAKKNIGKIDHQATNSSLFRQITNSDLRNKFDDFLVDIINRAAPKERIFQGYTNSGNRRYIPHDIDNVIKLLKKDLRGGENFKYGLGSIRAKYSPQFKSIDQIRKSKNRLMDSKTFDLVKKEIQTELDSLNESLASYGTFSGFDNVENMLSDAAKMGISRALKDNGFENVPDSIKIDIQNFINKLKDMPTEYFEAKLLRAVKLGEFTAAIIPDDSTQQVKDILKKNGIEDVREYKAGDNEDRVKQINQIDRVMFSRVAREIPETININGKSLSQFADAIARRYKANKIGQSKGSRYYSLPDGREIRVSDHEFPRKHGGGVAQIDIVYNKEDDGIDIFHNEVKVGAVTRELSYRSLNLRGGDIGGLEGFNYDIEAWEAAVTKAIDDAISYSSDPAKPTDNSGQFSTDNDDIRFSRASKQSDEDIEFADEVLRELASVDELFRYPVSNQSSLEDVMAEVYPGAKYRGESTREDERNETGSDHRFVFTSPYGRTFYVYERDNGEVFIDVSRFNPGEKGQAVYAAVANYAFNNDKVFIADPAGLTEDSLIRRTANMLSSALRYGTTRHLDAAPQQIKGDLENGIEPLDWRGDDLAKTKALIHTFITTLNNKFPEIKNARYDFSKQQFVGRMGVPVDWDKIKPLRDKGVGKEARAGQATMRQGVFVQSLISSESGERPGILEQVLNRASSLVSGGGFKALFSRESTADASIPDASTNQPIADTKQVDVPEETRFRKFQRKYQDSFNRFTVVKEWLADKGINLSQQADVYAAEERYHAKVANQVEDFREQIRNPLIEKIAKAGFTMDDIADYLEAQHAPEANAAIRKLRDDPEATAYGIADDEAREYLSKAPGELGKLANELRSITEQTKKLRLDGGLLNKDITDAWESTYKHYIPVKGAEQGNSGTGKGMSVKVKNKRRLGHGKRDEAVIENILQDHERAIMEVEKNRVGKHVVMMAAEIGIPELMTIGQPVKRQMLRNTTAYEVQVKGRTKAVFDTKEGANLFRQSLPLTDKKISLSDVVINPTADQRVVMSASPMLADNEINVYIDGHAIRVQINDELMARAYKKLGIEGYGEIVSAGRMLNSYLSKVYTGYNPEFIMTNMVRDFTTGVINLTGEQGLRMAAKAISNYPKSFATLLRYAATNGKQSTDWIDAYRRNGGNTGAAYLSDMERLGNEVSSEYAAYQGVIANLKQGDMANAARAAGRKAYNATLKWIYNLNQAGENAMRLSAFKAMIDSGMTVNDAAKAAKNITVNFNRKGELGVEANAAYLFFNASVQGTAATLHALVKGKNKYQAWALASGLTTLGYLAAASLGGGSEDDYDKIDDYTKERNALIKSGDGYLKLPIPYGYGFFWNVGRSMADAQRKDELHTMPWHIAASAIEELTPFGSIVVGSDGEFKSDQVLGGALPTVAQIPYQISNNKQLFSGGELMPDSPFDQSQPDREKMWRGTKGTMYDQVAGWLAVAGMDVSPETLKFMTRTATGGAGALVDSSVSAAMLKAEGAELDPEEMPFIRKAYKEISIKDTRSAFYKAREEAKLAAEEFNRARRKNDLVAMQTVINDKKEMLALDAYADKLSEVIRYARDQQDAVRLNKDIPIAEKRLKLKELEISEAKFYDKYLDVFNINKIEMKKRSKNDLN